LCNKLNEGQTHEAAKVLEMFTILVCKVDDPEIGKLRNSGGADP
jgi:hypothetical protein